ncbi:MAG: helix-turn-helix protein [Synergistetes bacterium ADurb.BinA166]|jgi:phage-related protein/predicted XRE-type DNA-binding protein|nr:MAG: helix-turn-helix protein [Synergistetes bacterium ADurb.BinA166]
MRIAIIVKDQFEVYAVKLNGDEEHDSFLLLSGRRQPSNKRDQNAVRSALARIARLSKSPRSLSETVCHAVAVGIWQITSDQYRIMWFYDEGRLIICTHYFVKKTQKTPPAQIERAKRMRDAYFKDKADGNLVKTQEAKAMQYGPEFESAFSEAMANPEYWMEEIRLDFIEELESLLKKKRISQTALARKLGKSDAYISKIMNSNISNFTLKTMVQLVLAAGGRLSLAIEDAEASARYDLPSVSIQTAPLEEVSRSASVSSPG